MSKRGEIHETTNLEIIVAISKLEGRVDATNTAITNLSNDLRETADGSKKSIADHEARLRVMEKINDQVNLLTFYQDHLTLKQEWHDYKTTARTWRVIGGIAGGAAMFILTQLPNILKLFGLIK